MESSKKYTWHKLADTAEELCADGKPLHEITINGKRVCIAKVSDELKACAAKCPHAGGDMSQGYVDALGNIVCPLHRYKFSLQNGRNVSGEGYFLKTYPIEINEKGIFIGFEEKTGFWSW